LNISGVGQAAAAADITNIASSASQGIIQVVNFPNPAGDGYAHPSGEGHTTVQFQTAKVAQEYAIHIYTLAGQLVRKVTQSEVGLNLSRSSDLKWVYEFDWDGKNGDGIHVASGVYLYLVKVDGETKVGKAVFIR